MATNKVIYFGQTLIDLTGDTVTADKMLAGATAHDKSGNSIEGSCTYDSDTQDATVAVAEMLDGKTAYARGKKLTGTMPNNGAVSGSIASKDDTFTVAQGYHDGSGSVGLASVEKAKLVPANIAEGVTLFGVVGAHKAGTQEVKQSKTVTPGKTSSTVLPDAGFTCLSQVTVEAIPYSESANAAGGTTVTIG